MKPRLPSDYEARLPDEVLQYLYTFVPHIVKKKSPPQTLCRYSPNMERDLRLLQSRDLRGKDNMFLRDLDDFILK